MGFSGSNILRSHTGGDMEPICKYSPMGFNVQHITLMLGDFNQFLPLWSFREQQVTIVKDF